MYMRDTYIEPLIFVGQKKGDLLPGLLSKWVIAPDAKSLTLTVRKGIKFHNGDEFTAKDVKFNLDRYSAKSYAHAGTVNAFIKSVEVIDDYTVRVDTNGVQPFAYSIMIEAGGSEASLMIPKNYYERVGAEGYQRNPVGTGPWKFSRHVLGDMFEFEAVENHWRHMPEFKKLALILIPEMTTRVAMLRSGGVDATDIGIEEATSLESLGFRTIKGGSNQVPVVQLIGAYEKGAGVIGDIRVRQALSLAINRDEIGKTFFHGKATPPVACGLGPLSGDIDLAYWKDYSAKMYGYDQAEAKRLLKEAGYPDGFNFRFYSMPVSGSPFLPDLAVIIQGYWRAIGVKAEIYPIETSLFYTFRNVSKVPTSPAIGAASIYRITESTRGPNTAQTFYNSFHTKDLFGLQGSSHPEIDQLIDATVGEIDAKKRAENIDKLIKITSEMWVQIPVLYVPSMFALASGVAIDDAMPPSIYHLAAMAYLAKHRK